MKINAAWKISLAIVAVGCVSAVINEHSLNNIAEGIGLALIVGYVLSRKPVQEQYQQWPKSIMVFGVVMLLLTISGQLLRRRLATFPFTPWLMYSQASVPAVAVFPEYIGVLDDGTEVPITVKTDMVVSLGRYTRMKSVRMLEYEKGSEEYKRNEELFVPLMRTYINTYMPELSPERPIVKFKLYKCRKYIVERETRPEIDKQLIAEYELEESIQK